MSNKKVRYQHWMDAMVDLTPAGYSSDKELEKTVRNALESLEEMERDLVERRFLMGQSIALIGEELELSGREIERGLREAALKLRRLLGPYIRERFNVKITSQRKCSICESSQRERAERIIAGKKPEEPWRRVMRELRKLGLRIDSPQALIGHAKYHLTCALPEKKLIFDTTNKNDTTSGNDTSSEKAIR